MPPLTLTNVMPIEVAPAAHSRNEARAEVAIVVALVGAIAALYAFAPDPTSVDPLHVGLSVLLLTVAHTARFDLRLAWTSPVQLALVPVLFLLPGWLVPITMALTIAIARVPDVLDGSVPASRLLLSPGNAWFTVGPAAVLAWAGHPSPAEATVPLLVGMLAAQVGTDFVISCLWQRLTGSWSLKQQIRDDYMIYLIDVALAPVGLLAAYSLDESPYSLLLLLPMFGVLAIFAGERRVRLRQLTELNGAYRGTAMVLAEVVDADDAYTGMHTRDVVELSLSVADALQLDEGRRRNVEFGALLHDVGKVAIPNAIINKAGPLTDAEWAVMRTHTVEGQRMLDRVGGAMSEVGEIVRASHERWDGGGYPDGLSGFGIPLEARIICACDAYNAMTTTRSYRKAMPPGEAVAELVRCSGTQFDPAVVNALIAVLGTAATPVREPLAA